MSNSSYRLNRLKKYEKFIKECCYKEEFKYHLTTSADYGIIARALLDSSLITRTNIKKYTIKLIHCGDYYQLYYYTNPKLKKEGRYEKIKSLDVNYLFKCKQNIKCDKKTIEYKNIMRSKFSLQRLAKANEDKFNTFITLTFAENQKDLTYCNKKLANWLRQVKRHIKDFSYICVPEFQKRGAVHFHLMTTLDIKKNPDIIIPQKEFTEYQYLKMTDNQRKACYDVKYWFHGYSSVFPIKKDEVVGYLTKYFTKDIDNRLFGHRRYTYSLNLNIPEELYLDLSNDNDFNILADILSKAEIKYNKTYLDVFKEPIDFVEYKKTSEE